MHMCICRRLNITLICIPCDVEFSIKDDIFTYYLNVISACGEKIKIRYTSREKIIVFHHPDLLSFIFYFTRARLTDTLLEFCTVDYLICPFEFTQQHMLLVIHENLAKCEQLVSSGEKIQVRSEFSLVPPDLVGTARVKYLPWTLEESLAIRNLMLIKLK